MSPQNGAKVINPISFTAANGKKSNQAQEKVNQRKDLYSQQLKPWPCHLTLRPW